MEAINELVAMMEGHLRDHLSIEEVEAGKITIRELRRELKSARAENKKLSGELNVANEDEESQILVTRHMRWLPLQRVMRIWKLVVIGTFTRPLGLLASLFLEITEAF